MFYKTKRTSETGLKLASMVKKMDHCQSVQQSLGKVFGFSKFRGKAFVAFGGIGCVFFDKTPDLKTWRKTQDGYMPRKKGKLGKKIAKTFEELPTVSAKELNACVGLETGPEFKVIGLTFSNPDYFLFAIGADWLYGAPEDCEELTKSEFEKLR